MICFNRNIILYRYRIQYLINNINNNNNNILAKGLLIITFYVILFSLNLCETIIKLD